MTRWPSAVAKSRAKPPCMIDSSYHAGVGGGVGMYLAAGGGVCQCAAEQVDDQQRGGERLG